MNNIKGYEGKKDGIYCAVMAAILLAVLLFFCSGVPGTDDEQLFASAAQSHAQRGEFTALQMWGNARVMGRYTMIAPLHVLLGSLAYRLAALLPLGRLQIFFILSPGYIVLTAYLLMQMALGRGYSRRTAGLAAAAFCLTTILFPYSKTFFREPLAMLLLVIAFFLVDISIMRPQSFWRNFLRLFLALLAFLLAVWTKEFLIACLPFLLIKVVKNKQALFPEEKGSIKNRTLWRLVWVVIIALLTAIVAWLLQDRSGRFSISYFTRLVSYLPIMPHENFLQALLGMFFSASKGFFIYSPLLILGLFFPSSEQWKKDWQDWVFTLGASLGVAALQAFAYDANWWTFTWGTRFLLPVIPFWMLILLPFVDSVWGKRVNIAKVAVMLLMVLGLMIQLGGVLISDADYTSFLWVQLNMRMGEARVTHWETLPAPGHWLAALRGEGMDVGWMRGLERQNLSMLVAPMACALMSMLGWLILTLKKPWQGKATALFLLLTLALPLLVVGVYQQDPIYAGRNQVFQDVLDYFEEKTSPAETILIDGYNLPLWYFYFNFSPLPNEWIGLPFGMQTARGASMLYPRLQETINLVNDRHASGARIWLVSGIRNTPMQSTYEEALIENGWRILASNTFNSASEPSVVKVDELIKK